MLVKNKYLIDIIILQAMLLIIHYGIFPLPYWIKWFIFLHLGILLLIGAILVIIIFSIAYILSFIEDTKNQASI